MQEQSQTEVEKQSIGASLFRIVNPHIADIAFLVLLAVLMMKYNSTISTYQVPISDGAAYLTNARNWLVNEPLFQIYRPPLISWMIAGVWSITGENWVSVKYLSALFGFASAPVLYLALRRDKGAFFALGAVILTVLNSEVFYYTSQLLTEGSALFFLLATLYFVKSEKPGYWFLAGICIGLTFASRYPIVLQAGLVALVESFTRKNWRILTRAIATAVPVVVAVVAMVFLKTGTFQTALAKDTNFTFFLSPYYVQNSIVAWGWVFLLVPIAFILRETYVNRYNWVFVAWFVFSLLFWSANATNHDLRFTIQFTPAVNFLALLALERFVKNSEPLRLFLSKELLFLGHAPFATVLRAPMPQSQPGLPPTVTPSAPPHQPTTHRQPSLQQLQPSPQPFYPQSIQPTWQTSICPNCNTPAAPDANFCDLCGTRLR